MKIAFRVATWNVEGRLAPSALDGTRSTPELIARQVLQMDADVVFLPEAFRGNSPNREVVRLFEKAGYHSFVCAYGDTERLSEEADAATYSLVLSRLLVRKAESVRYDAYRSLPVVTLSTEGSDVIVAGMHLDDRSENQRSVQVSAIVERFRDLAAPLILMGDFNAMHHSKLARLYNLPVIRSVARIVPHPFISSMIVRFSEMASGTVLHALMKNLSLYDADNRRRATATPKLRGVEWMPSIRLAQLDHILLSKDFTVNNIRVLPDGGSDHRAVVADIALDKS